MSALRAYFDGSKSAGKSLTLACLAADEPTWSEIESDWEQVRKSRGNPRYFHMTDAIALEKQFKGWDPDQRDYLIDGLLNVLLKFRPHPRIHSFTCSVDLKAYEALQNDRNFPPAARLCARIVFPQMADWYSNLPDKILGPIEAYFDRSEPFMRHVEPDWRNKEIRRRHPAWALIRKITSLSMESSPALQMTDVIAWGRNRLACGSHWETDPHYTTAVRAANTIRWIHRSADEGFLSRFVYREEGYAAIDPQRTKQALISNTSDEYKKFDRMMKKPAQTSRGKK